MASLQRRSSMNGVNVMSYGNGGIAEFATNLDNKQVSYGVVKMTFGSGSFARPKNIFVHFNGAECGAVKRGRANAKLPRAERELKPTHAQIKVETVDEVTEEYFTSELSSKFMDDSHLASMTTFSIGTKVQYHNAVIEAEAAKAEGTETVARTAAEMNISAARALEMVRDIKGPFNWILVKPKGTKLELHNAGAGSVEEMREYLVEDEVLFGLVRMGFGTGRFRRTYWWFAHWSPDNVGAVKRGKANSAKGKMQDQLKPFSLGISASHEEEITLEAVIDRLKRAVVVEGSAQADAGGAEAFSLESFAEALREEQAENSEFFGVPADGAAAEEKAVDQEELTAEAVLDKILSDSDPVNWGIFSF